MKRFLIWGTLILCIFSSSLLDSSAYAGQPASVRPRTHFERAKFAQEQMGASFEKLSNLPYVGRAGLKDSPPIWDRTNSFLESLREGSAMGDALSVNFEEDLSAVIIALREAIPHIRTVILGGKAGMKAEVLAAFEVQLATARFFDALKVLNTTDSRFFLTAEGLDLRARVMNSPAFKEGFDPKVLLDSPALGDEKVSNYLDSIAKLTRNVRNATKRLLKSKMASTAPAVQPSGSGVAK